ncbi:DUF397 domain-containing protein [Kitasatospora acidiphila]|uniref:DUF397 domain-containing protein n=1 Tax=Kitasatospora acidiphila TaxID=2567942 RepID=A0A540W6U3_9ACTN|nr:DUF397 domain-containing protein [Kitasatospora acidiphila]TQF04677.1 DUF397 domain-containing protein [Kitasatospora acidiphila]
MSTELTWCKSSYSTSAGDDCIEVALDWRKSSYSDSEGGNCVEIAAHPTTVHIRDSKDKAGPHLSFSPAAWAAFAASAPELRASAA